MIALLIAYLIIGSVFASWLVYEPLVIGDRPYASKWWHHVVIPIAIMYVILVWPIGLFVKGNYVS